MDATASLFNLIVDSTRGCVEQRIKGSFRELEGYKQDNQGNTDCRQGVRYGGSKEDEDKSNQYHDGAECVSNEVEPISL